MATGTPTRDDQCEAARALRLAIAPTVAEATAALVRLGLLKPRDEERARPGRRPNETVCCPSLHRYRSALSAPGPCVAPGVALEPTMDRWRRLPAVLPR